MRRIIAVLALALIAFLGSGAVANAATPKLTPQQTYAKCVADAGIKALKEIDKQTWKSKAAREAALKALIAKIKAACPKPGTGGGGTPTPTDVCPNIEGNQATVPAGYVRDAGGNCVKETPPPNIQNGPPIVSAGFTTADFTNTQTLPVDGQFNAFSSFSCGEFAVAGWRVTGATSLVTSVHLGTTTDFVVVEFTPNPTDQNVSLTLSITCSTTEPSGFSSP